MNIQKITEPFSTKRMASWTLLLSSLFALVVYLEADYDLPTENILLIVGLYVVTVLYSIPLKFGYVGLTPIVALAIMYDRLIAYEYVLIMTFIGLIFAEMVRSLWSPYNRYPSIRKLSYVERSIFMGLHVLDIMLFKWMGEPLQKILDMAEEIPNTQADLTRNLLVAVFYFLFYFLTRLLVSAVFRFYPRAFLKEIKWHIVSTAMFSLPLILFVLSVETGLYAYLLVSVCTLTMCFVNSSAWIRDYVLQRRFTQFTSLNETGNKLRNSLNLSEVLRSIEHQISDSFQLDSFRLLLKKEDGRWETPNYSVDEVVLQAAELTELESWVVTNNRMIELHPGNIHRARERGIQMPENMPSVWLGVPLQSADELIGALIIEKTSDGEPYSRWAREMLISFSGQASSAIQNARLHDETLRLFNLTDQALAERVKQLQALLDTINEGVIMINTEGRSILLNPTIANLVNRSIDTLRKEFVDPEIIARPLGFEPDELAGIIAGLQQNQPPAEQTDIYEYETPYRQLVLSRSGLPVYSKQQDLIGWLIVIRDITEERERAEWRADLTRMIVHDLRNPITTIRSSVDLFEEMVNNEDPYELDEYVNVAKHGCDTMLEMVDSLMDINRAEVGKFFVDPDEMRLDTLVQDVMKQLQPLAMRRNIDLAYQLPASLPSIWGDRQILRRVLVNFLDNAIKFTPSDGNVTFRAFIKEDGGIRCEVIDTGTGIPDDLRDRIFDRFVTFNSGGAQVRGTGLGLTFCKLAIEEHGGNVSVRDNPMGGTIFEFTLPGMPDFDAMFAE